MTAKLLVILLILPLAPTVGQDLFSEVFGEENEQVFPIPVVRQGVQLGEVSVRVSRNTAAFNLDQLTAIMRTIVDDQTVVELESLTVDRNGAYVEVGSLNPLGIVTIYRPEAVELEVEISPHRLREQMLNTGSAPVLPNVQDPSPLSGYLNLFSRGSLSSAGERDFVQAEFEPVVNWQSWVIEGAAVVGADVGETTTDVVSLRSARVVRDVPDDQIRAEGGIPRYTADPLFSTPEIVGVAVNRRGEMRPDRPLRRDGRISFVVPRRGPVEVALNGRTFRTYNLNEGPHTIVDLPLGRGSNLVEVMQPTESGDGTVTLAAARIPYAPGLLRSGRHQYSYAAGVFRDDRTEPFVSGEHAVGVIPELTVGFSAQASLDRFTVGARLLGAGDWGITRFSGAISGPGGVGIAGELQHAISVLYSRWNPTVEFVAGARNPQFGTVSQAAGGGDMNLGAYYTQRLPASVIFGLGMVRRWRFEPDAPVETTLRFTATHQSAGGFSINAQIGPTVSGGTLSWQGSLFFRFADGARSVNTSAAYNITEGPASLSVTAVPERSLDTWRWNAGYQGFDRSPGQPQILRGSAGYDGYQFSARLEPYAQRTIGATEGEFRVGGQFSSAVAFAGRTAAITRPIRDSFVLVKPRPPIAAYPVPIRGSGGGLVTRMEGGAAVIPDLRSYRSSTISADGSYLPDGYSVGADRYSFIPSYRSGYHLMIGSASSVYIRGRLVDGSGEPIDLEAGEVLASDGSTTSFFTNQEGEFEILELSPGEYRLRLYSDPLAETVFAVPEDVVGRYDLEDVVLLWEGP